MHERSVGNNIAGAVAAGLLLAVLVKQGLDLDGRYLLKVSVGLVAVAWLLDRGYRGAVDAGPAFGVANQVTLLRAVLAALLLGLLGESAGETVLWVAVAIATVASLSDALDGWLARRTATASGFGARFDMETDAALIAVLALLAWYWDRAGAWVLIAGAARYVFVAATLCFQWMRRELPASRRRKLVCVVQTVALVLCLAPLLDRSASALVAAVGVSALLGSFVVDTLWLARAERAATALEARPQ